MFGRFRAFSNTTHHPDPQMSSAVEIEITDQILGVQDYPDSWTYPLVMSKKLLKMSIEIVEIPIKHGDFP